MSYDRELADRIRELLQHEESLTEKAMFGGLAFLLNGNMAVAANKRGGLMVRIDPADADTLTEQAGVERMVMGGRSMDGWLTVEASDLDADQALAEWVNRGTSYARSLPAK